MEFQLVKNLSAMKESPVRFLRGVDQLVSCYGLDIFLVARINLSMFWLQLILISDCCYSMDLEASGVNLFFAGFLFELLFLSTYVCLHQR